MPLSSSLPESYIKLALALDRHIEGYVDCYFGPPEWRTESQAAGKLPLAELTQQANDLASALARDSELDASRSAFLVAQVRAMQTSLDNVLAALDAYHTNVGKYPQTLEQLTTPLDQTDFDICGSSTALTIAAKWRGPYLPISLTTRGLQIADYLANNTLVRTPTRLTFGRSSFPNSLDSRVAPVRSGASGRAAM